MRPFFLPREFTNIFVVATYIPPNSNYEIAKSIVCDKISHLISLKPNSVLILCGDINNCTLVDTLPSFQQYVNKPTRGNAILDHVYCNIKKAYFCKILSPLGKSDHKVVQMKPIYVKNLLRKKHITEKIKTINSDGLCKLESILSSTDWNIFIQENSECIHSLTDTVSSYIRFCTDECSTIKTVKIYSNNKPWYSNEVRQACHDMRRSYGSEDYKQYKNKYRKAIKMRKKLLKIKLKIIFLKIK